MCEENIVSVYHVLYWGTCVLTTVSRSCASYVTHQEQDAVLILTNTRSHPLQLEVTSCTHKTGGQCAAQLT